MCVPLGSNTRESRIFAATHISIRERTHITRCVTFSRLRHNNPWNNLPWHKLPQTRLWRNHSIVEDCNLINTSNFSQQPSAFDPLDGVETPINPVASSICNAQPNLELSVVVAFVHAIPPPPAGRHSLQQNQQFLTGQNYQREARKAQASQAQSQAQQGPAVAGSSRVWWRKPSTRPSAAGPPRVPASLHRAASRAFSYIHRLQARLSRADCLGFSQT